jgi:hypothetical protein
MEGIGARVIWLRDRKLSLCTIVRFGMSRVLVELDRIDGGTRHWVRPTSLERVGEEPDA